MRFRCRLPNDGVVGNQRQDDYSRRRRCHPFGKICAARARDQKGFEARRTSGRAEEPFAAQGLLDSLPHCRRGIVHGNQQAGSVGNIFQVLHQIGADRTGIQMPHLFLLAAAFNKLRQVVLKFRARHSLTFLPL